MEKNSKHSNKSKLQISNSNLGRIPWNKDLKGIKTNNKGGTSWNKDIPCNDNTKEKISNKLKLNYENGYINPSKNIPKKEETKQKISNTIKQKYLNGYISPLKNIFKTKEQKLQISDTLKKKYKLGLIKNNQTEDSIKRASISLKKNWENPSQKRLDGIEKGRKIHIEKMKIKDNRDRISDTLKEKYRSGFINPNKGRKQPHTKEQIRKALSYKEKRSFPERILFNKVKEIYPFAKANEKIETKNSWRKPDILLDKFNITIEFDGTHFHKIENDIERDKALVEVGYKRLHYRGYQPDNDEIINDVNNLLENNINGLYKENNKTILQII